MSDDRPGSTGGEREREWLAREVRAARDLTDRERVRIMDELYLAIEAIRRGKSPEQLRRDEEVRRSLDRPGRERYRRLAESFE